VVKRPPRRGPSGDVLALVSGVLAFLLAIVGILNGWFAG
jgi:hypothetical protein